MKVQPTTQQLIAMLYERLPELFDRPQRQSLRDVKPLTDEQISDIWCRVSNTDFVTVDTHEFARAIEAAHGIKENT